MTFAQNTSATYPKQPMNGRVQIVNADAQAQKTIYTAGANGSKLTSLLAVSTDTSSRDVQISITNGGTSYPIGTVTIPAGAGNTGGVAAQNILGGLVGLAVDSDGNFYIHLQSGDTLTASALATVTTAKTITVSTPTAADF